MCFIIFLIFVFCVIMFLVTLNRNIGIQNDINSSEPPLTTEQYTIVGVTHSHFGNHSQTAFQDLQTGDSLFLYPDTNNKHDPYAVVIKTYDDKYVGWLPSGCKEIYDILINNPEKITATLSEKYVLFDENDNEKTYRNKTMYGGNIKVNIY